MKSYRGSAKKIDDRAVQGYARDLAKVIILDAPTERLHFAEYKRTGSLVARNKIIESGLRFVIKVAQGYARDLEHHKQLIAAGNEGLLVAVDRFDVTRGTRFLSYATWWVTLHIREELHRSSVVTIPMWRKKSLRKVRAARESAMDKHGRAPTEHELKTATGLSTQQLAGLTLETYEMLPLEAAETVSAPEMDVEHTVIDGMGDRLVQYLISQLPIRDAFVCRAYFGFLTDPPMSLKQVAAILGISSERVRQIKMEALATLRRYLEHLEVTSASDVYR
jgi:RNA polymerase primary sigma factor